MYRITHYWLALLTGLLVVSVAACVQAPAGTPVPPPTTTPVPWRPPAMPVTTANVEQMVLLGRSSAVSGTAYHIDFSMDGRWFLTVSGDNTVRLWDVESGHPVWQKTEANVSRAFFTGDDRYFVLVARDGQLAVYDRSSRTLERSFTGHNAAIGPSVVSPDGRILALGASDGTVNLWQVANEQQAAQVLQAHNAPIQGLYFSPDSRLLATMSNERVVRLWEVSSGTTRAVLADFDGRPQSVAFSSDGERIAVNTTYGVRVWRTADGTQLRSIPAAVGEVDRAIAFTPNGIVAGGQIDTVAIYDLSTGNVTASLPGHGEQFHSLALNPAGDLLVTLARPDGQVFLWNLLNPNQRVQLSTREDNVSLVAWSRDGRVLVLVAADGTLSFWGIPGDAGAATSD